MPAVSAPGVQISDADAVHSRQYIAMQFIHASKRANLANLW